MKIVIINSLYSPNFLGGAERSVQSLAEELVTQGHTVHVVTTGETDDVDTLNGVIIYYFKTSRFSWLYNSKSQHALLKIFWHLEDIYNWKAKRKVSQLLSQVVPDVVHTNNISGFSVSMWDLCRQNKIPVIHTIRDYHLICYKNTMFRSGQNCSKQCFDCKLVGVLKKVKSQNINAVIGISDYVLNIHRSLAYFNQTEIKRQISNAVNHINIVDRPKKTGVIRFGYIGRIEQEKGVEILLEAFSKAKKNLNTIELLLAGKVETTYAKNLANSYASTSQFLGYQNTNEFLASIDILVVPSIWNEPFGRVIIEAQSAGIMVIASDVGGISEILPDQYLFRPDIKSLSQKILEVCEIEGNSYVKSNQSSVFEVTDMASAYTNIYKELLND